MRRAIFRMDETAARSLLAAAERVEVASTTPEGAPILRTLNAALVGERLCFHGAPVGEKTLALGREAVVSAVEVVATVPSYFVDPERACPATTLYRSVQVHGTLEEVHDPRTKAAALAALMDKHQPEGGFAPIAAAHPLYRKALEGVLVFGVSLARLDGKCKLGQHRGALDRGKIVAGLWARGEAGDPRAVDLILDASPDTPPPDVFRAPPGLRLRAGMGSRAEAEAAAALLAGTYWNDRFTPAELTEAHLGSSAWVRALDEDGRLVGSARALSDGRKRAWIYDVIVEPARRGQGIGAALVGLLLDHPRLRRARIVQLGTRDAEGFYARWGFVPTSTLPARPYRSVEMTRLR